MRVVWRREGWRGGEGEREAVEERRRWRREMKEERYQGKGGRGGKEGS